MSKLVTIFGGSGFLGRYIARRLAKDGWRIRVAVRNPNLAMFVRPYGAVGQVEPMFCNIRDDESVRSVMHGADAVVNCVGTFDAFGKNNFDAVQHEGAERVARISVEQGVGALVHVSAIGADADAASGYSRSKAAGEAGVLAHRPDAVILRPSVIFGAEDEFFNRFATMANFTPVLPIAGGNTLFQPVHVDDVAHAATLGVEGNAPAGTYELGGPHVASFRDLMKDMLVMIRRRRFIFNMPFWMARFMAWGFRMVQIVSLGLVKPPLTQDQVKALGVDNIVSEGAKSFDDLGIRPASMEAILPDYLWRFRPSGQYSAIKESAKNIRAQ